MVDAITHWRGKLIANDFAHVISNIIVIVMAPRVIATVPAMAP